MKKSIRKIVSVLMAVCLCTSMVPASAMAAIPTEAEADQDFLDSAGSSPTVGNTDRYGDGVGDVASNYEQLRRQEGTASTKVFGVIQDENFKFTGQSPDLNFSSVQDAIDNTQPGATPGPLYAIFGGNNGSFEYLWTLDDVTIEPDGSYSYAPHVWTGTPPTFTGPSDTALTGGSGTVGTIGADGNPVAADGSSAAVWVPAKFGDPDNGFRFDYSIQGNDELEPEKVYRYTLFIKNPSNTTDNLIKAEILVSTYANFESMKIFRDQNENSGTSVEGFLYKNLGLDPTKWTAPILSGQEVAETSPVYSIMANEAAKGENGAPVQGITQPTQLVITNLQNKPDSEPPYKLGLNVHLEVPADYPGTLEVGDTVPVYRFDQETGTVEKLEGTVVQQTDADGRPITVDGQPVLSIEFPLKGTGAALGTFAVGYDSTDGAFTVEASAAPGGSISPEGTLNYVVGASPKFVMSAQAGYELTGVSLQRNGAAVTVQTGSLVGNVFTLDAARYGMADGQAWTVRAQFAEATPQADEYSVRASLTGAGSGNMDVISGAPGAQKNPVAMGGTLDWTSMPAKSGVYLDFYPGDGYRVESLKINNEEFAVAGTSYFISALTENVNIEVVYAEGLPDPTVWRTIKTTVVAGNGSVMDSDGNPQSSAELKVNYGGTGTVTLLPDQGYLVQSAILRKAGSTDGIDMADHLTQNNGQGNLQIRNVLDNMELDVTFVKSSGTITISVEGNVGGTVSPVGPVQMLPDKAVTVRITPDKDSQGNPYTVGKIKLNGMSIPIANYLTERNGGEYYTFNIVMSDLPVSNFEKNPDGTVDKVLPFTDPNSTLEISFDGVTPPGQGYVSVITSVDGQGGSITPTQRVLAGSTVTVYAFPDEGKKVKDITLEGKSVKHLLRDLDGNVDPEGPKLVLDNVLTDQNVVVSFEDGNSDYWPSKKKRFTVNATAGNGGSVTPSPQVLVYEGEDQVFTFLANTGYELSGINRDGVDVQPDAPGADEPVATRYTLKASEHQQHDGCNLLFTFKKTSGAETERGTFNVQINAGQNGTASPLGTVAVARGTDLPITVLPNANYSVDKIMVRFANSSSADAGINFAESLINGVYTQADVQDDLIIDITFKEGADPDQPSTDLNNLIRLGTKNASIDAGVVISPQVPGLTFYKEEGTDHANINQTFTIQVGSGYALGDVKVNGKTLSVTEVAEGVYSFVVPKEEITSQMLLEVAATQVPPPTQVVDLRTITVTKEGNGTVSPYGIINGVVRVETGESQTFYFLPDDGNKVERVEVDGSSVSWDEATSSYTIPAVTQDMRLHVVFAEDAGATRPQTATVKVTIDPGSDGKNHGFASVSTAEVAIPNGQLNITFKPDSGYETHVYRGTGAGRTEITDQLHNGTLYLTGINEDRSYSVAFTPLTQTVSYQTVTASAGSNGRISPEGTMTVVTGSSMSFTFLGNDGYTVDKVWVTRGTAESEDVTDQIDRTHWSYTVTNITESVDIWVSFKKGSPSGGDIKPCILEATAGPGGMVSPARIEATPGSTASFTFIPLRGYELLSVTADGADVTGSVTNGVYSFQVTSNASIHALFTSSADSNPEGNKHDVILQVANGADGQPHGQISPSGLVTVPHGGSVPFTMIPDEGYKVGSIQRTLNGITSEVKDFSGFKYTLFDVEANTTITVTFVPLSEGEVIQRPVFYEVEATATINGTISPSGTIKVAEGGMAMFSFQPNEGYRLSYLVVDGKNTPASAVSRGQYTFLGVQENHTIHAVFCKADEEAADFVTVNAGRPSGGTITPAGAQLVFRGSSPQFTVSAFYGYTLADIQVNGQSIFSDGPDGTKNVAPVNNAQVSWANSTLTLKNVQVDTGIVALFRQSDDVPDTEAAEYSRVTMNASGAGSTSFRNGTTTIEALKPQETLDVSLIPNEGYAIGSLHVQAANGEDLDLTDATDPKVAQQLKDYWRKGYLTLTADQVNHDVTITVTFRKQTDAEKEEIANGQFTPAKFRTISSMAFGRGSINPHGMIKVAHNASARFSMIPESGYELSALRVDEHDAMGRLNGGRSYTFTPGTQDQKIEATFGQLNPPDAGVTYFVRTAIDGTDGASGNASVSEVEVYAGGSASLYFWPEKGSKLTGLTVSMKNGNDTDEQYFAYNLPEYTVSGITGDTLVTAHFEPLGPDETTWDVTEAYVEGFVLNEEIWEGAASGLGVATDGIVFDNSGGRISPQKATVPKGCQQVFNFFPNEGYEVAFLLVNGQVVYVDAQIRSYPMIVDSTDPSNPDTLVVAFRDLRSQVSDVTVTAKVDFEASEGSAEVWPGSRTVAYGSSASFFVRPERGYTIVSVTWDDGVNEPQSVPFDGIKTDKKEHYSPNNAPWDLASRAADEPSAQADSDLEERDAFFEVYQFTIPNVTRDVTANVRLAPISKVNPTKGYDYYYCNAPTLEITSEGGGIVMPVGKGFLPEGYSETIRLSAFTGYYLESVICTYGDGTTVDMTNRVVGNSLQVVMGSQDMHIHAKFTPVGETSFVHFELGTAKDPFGNDLVYTGQVTTTPPLSVNGVPTDFVRDTDGTGDGVLMGFLPDEGVVGPNGRPLVLDKVFVNGQQIPLTYPDSQYTRIPTTAGGTIDVVFRELEEGHEIIVPDMFTLSAEVTSGQGTVSPSIKLPVGKGTSQKVGFQPAEGWMLDTENCFDWYKEDGAEEATAHKISAEDLANGYYLIEGIDRDHHVTVAFVSYVNLELGWTNGDDGYVTPNTMNGEALKVEAGKSVPYIVAPYEGFDVESVVETMDGVESNVTGTLRTSAATTQQLLAMPGHEGFDVKHKQEGMGVAGPVAANADADAQSLEPLVQAETPEGDVHVDAPLAPASAAPALASFNYAYGSQTSPIMNDTTVMATWTHEDDVVKPELRTVTVEIIGEGGTADPMVGTGYDGEYITFNFFPDDGYAVRYLELGYDRNRDGKFEDYVDGNGNKVVEIESYRSDSAGGKEEYAYGPIDGDGYIKVGFDSTSHPGANDTLSRYLRTLQALAQTGDLTAPLIAGLLGIAVLALFMAFITGRRRKKKQQHARH